MHPGEATASFDAYVARHWSRLVRSAVLLGADVHAAEDAVQTALARCHLSWRRVQGARDPDAYVHRVLINVMHDQRRRRSWGERPVERLPEGAVDDGTRRSHDEMVLRAALARLPEKQREVVVLRFYADLSEAQTAKAVGAAVGTVKSRCSRALAALAADPALARDDEETR